MAKKATAQQTLINKVEIGQVRRQQETIQNWRNAIDAAENIKLPKRGDLMRIYKEIMLDGHLSSIVDKRIRAVKTSRINFMQDGKDTSDMMEWIRGPWFAKLLSYIMEAKFYGHSLIEPILVDGMIDKVKLFPRHMVSPELGVVYLKPNSLSTAVQFREPPYDKMLLEVGEEDDLGLLVKAAPYVLYKRGNFGDWAQFCELFGMPIREFTYNQQDPESRVLAKEAAEASGSASYIIVPTGVDLKLHQGTDGNSSTVYDQLRSALNDELSILILGQNLTTSNSDTGSYSLGSVHKSVEEAINLEDKIETEYVLNWQFKDMLQLFGYDVEKGLFRFDDTIKLPLDKQLEMDIKLAQRVPVADQYFYDKYGIPIPGKSDTITVQPGTAQAPATDQGSNQGGDTGKK